MNDFYSRAVLFLLLAPIGLKAEGGAYSSHASDIWGGTQSRISAPDGKRFISVVPPTKSGSDETQVVSVAAGGHEYRTEIGSWVDAEIAWAPDSKAFFVTYSTGGNIGTFHVKIFYVADSGIKSIEPIPNGRRLLVPNCFDQEFPNVGAIKWLGTGSDRLLVGIEVPPHSSCANMGTFEAFEIALPSGRVLARYGQLEAKRLFRSDLGIELQNAEDGCIRRAGTCVPRRLLQRHPPPHLHK